MLTKKSFMQGIRACPSLATKSQRETLQFQKTPGGDLAGAWLCWQAYFPQALLQASSHPPLSPSTKTFILDFALEPFGKLLLKSTVGIEDRIALKNYKNLSPWAVDGELQG